MPTEQSYLSYFTPSQMSHEMLEAILVKRHKLVARLVDNVAQSALTATKHQALLLGPRGMGKSYLLALVYHRVKALSTLEGKLAIAYFAEEEWSVASLADLLLVILKALEREHGGLQQRIEALYRMPVRDIESAAATLVREFVGERTLFILVENLDEIFRALGDKDQWAFRSFLSDHPFVTILATTPRLFDSISKQESAFYGYFQSIYLEELTVEEATELLEKVAERRADRPLADFLKTSTAQNRVQAVHDLAGGHPRIYLLFAHLLTQKTLDELVTPFLQLLDELTPYYQSRMQLLSPQQRKIVEFLCTARGAITVREIATQNLLTPQTTSGQLDKLEEMAYVRKTPIGRDSYYELREPLLRMVIEVKRGRGEPVRLIVDFLRRWYDRHERKERLAAISPEHPLTMQYLIAALDLERAIQDIPDWNRAHQSICKYNKYFNNKQYTHACVIAAEVIERKGRSSTIDDWIEYALCLIMSHEYKKSLPVLEKIFNTNNNFNIFILKMCVLNILMKYSEVVQCCDQVLSIQWSNPPSVLWTIRGNAYLRLGDYSKALFNYEKDADNNHKNSFGMFSRAEAYLAVDKWQEFIEALTSGFALFSAEEHWKEIEHWFGWTKAYCSFLLRGSNFSDKIVELTSIYAKNNDLETLGDGLTQSIPKVFEDETSQSKAEEWLSAWKNASTDHDELQIPARILEAAVEWKRTRSMRALMVLPIEERRILESLLPKLPEENAGAVVKSED